MAKTNFKKNNNNKKKLYIWGTIVFLFLALAIYTYSGVPSLDELENPKPPLASRVFSADGELIGQFFIENRIATDLDSLPPYVIKALVATEDRNFYDHWGVDIPRFFKAMIKNLFSLSLREGASTITQQLAKNLYSLKEGRENPLDKAVRKVREWISAIQIERTFTKNEIAELYLNVSYFGRSAYGIESAAKVYFNKRAKDLTLPEAALFVALLKSSVNYDPVTRYETALQRRNQVMYNMVDVDMLTEDEYNRLKQQPIQLASEKLSHVRSEAPHFLEYIRQQMTTLADKYGYDLYRDGLNIYTTLDLRMQRIANRSAKKHIAEYQTLFDKNWKWDSNKSLLTDLLDKAIKNDARYKTVTSRDAKAKIYNRLKYDVDFVDSVKKIAQTVEVGFVVLDPKTGFIKTLVGGENQNFGRGLNHVTGIRRQPGSSFKPFVYATALENGYTPASTVLNQQFNYNGWSPSNAGNGYSGYETLRWGLANSVNVIAGRLTISDMAPPYQVVKFAQRMGIKSHMDAYPSIALGTVEVTPLEMVSAMGTFINSGVHVDPISIIKIEDRNGVVLDEFVPESVQAISPQTSSIIVDMMTDVINYGTGAGVRRYFQYPAAGKTGTTQKFSDAWFVGVTPTMVAGAWVGFDDHRVKFTNWYGQGGRAALPIWAMFMEGAYKELKLPLKYFTLANGVEMATFCKESMNLGDAKLATDACPETYTDLINSGKAPGYCEIHAGNGGRIIHENKDADSEW
ncbi:MAG: PBP1A family penicillin-binding protein [Ignavibacteriales bacterium]|nr:PBP1A family penicillin-binding protein [Ignavibacteriales bacterium]